MANAILENLANSRQSKVTHVFTLTSHQHEVFWQLQMLSSAMCDQLNELSKYFPEHVDLHVANKWHRLSDELGRWIRDENVYEKRVTEAN